MSAETTDGARRQPAWMEVWDLGLPVGALLMDPCWNYHLADVHHCLNTGINCNWFIAATKDCGCICVLKLMKYILIHPVDFQ